MQRIFRPVFNAEDLRTDGSDFDHLFADGETFRIGELTVEVMHTPGHTPADICYKIGDAVFVGDTLFMPDYGTARADFPGGDAAQLYRSIQRLLALAAKSFTGEIAPKLRKYVFVLWDHHENRAAGTSMIVGQLGRLALPPETRLFMCHDYKAPGRDTYAWETTVREERDGNVHLKGGVTEAAFVAKRKARDATLSAPTLLLPSIQVNIRAGRFPKAQQNGVHYLLLPVRPKTEAAATIMS